MTTKTDLPLKERPGSVRMVAQLEVRANARGRKTLRGIFTPFNEWTHIRGWEGDFYERSVPGAFQRTIKHSWDTFKRTGRHSMVVNYNHGHDGQVGTRQLGKISVLEERAEGPYYEVELLDTEYNREYIIPATEDGLLGASYRFAVPSDGDEWNNRGPNGEVDHRTIREAAVFEFGPVDHPAYEAATAGLRTTEEYQLWRSLDEEGRQELAGLIARGRSLGTPAYAELATETESDLADSTSDMADGSPQAPVDVPTPVSEPQTEEDDGVTRWTELRHRVKDVMDSVPTL